MKWGVRLDDKHQKPQKYAIQSGPYIICKTGPEGSETFTLWKHRERIDNYPSADTAKEAAILDNA